MAEAQSIHEQDVLSLCGTAVYMQTMESDVEWWEIGLRLCGAALCAAAIGWERESKGRDAGLRTHMMVALGAAAFSIVALDVQWSVLENEAGGAMTVDPVRIIAAVVGGVGFLGAGAIIQSRGGVRGLTTAAGLWVTAAIGIAAGLGFYLIATYVTLIALAILGGVRVIGPKQLPERTPGAMESNGGNNIAARVLHPEKAAEPQEVPSGSITKESYNATND